jgi:hypothetical protein
MLRAVKYRKGTNEERKDKEQQQRNKLKKVWIAKDISIIKKEREIVMERTNGEGIITICHELDLKRPVADPSVSLFKGLPSRLRGGSKEEMMNEGKTEERKTGKNKNWEEKE